MPRHTSTYCLRDHNQKTTRAKRNKKSSHTNISEVSSQTDPSQDEPRHQRYGLHLRRGFLVAGALGCSPGVLCPLRRPTICHPAGTLVVAVSHQPAEFTDLHRLFAFAGSTNAAAKDGAGARKVKKKTKKMADPDLWLPLDVWRLVFAYVRPPPPMMNRSVMLESDRKGLNSRLIKEAFFISFCCFVNHMAVPRPTCVNGPCPLEALWLFYWIRKGRPGFDYCCEFCWYSKYKRVALQYWFVPAFEE